MRIVVKLFAGARALVGAEQVEIELERGSKVSELRTAMISAYPELTPLAAHMMFAINANYASDEVTIPVEAEVACIPPVSGG